MSYEFNVDLGALFRERYPQFVNLGVPAADLDRARAAITGMWADAPGGWTYELSAAAAAHASRGEHLTASLLYGVARFPVSATEARREALRKQVEQYCKAAPTFPVRFERTTVDVPYRGATTPVPVHLMSAAEDYSRAAVLLFSGGIDTWKMDLHSLIVRFALEAGVTVLAFDLPGTGETEAPLDAHADEVVLGLVDAARRLGDGRAAHFGLSFGGNFSAMTALTGAVDAAIDVGGPVDAAFTVPNAEQLKYGMTGIVANAYGFDSPPTPEQLIEACRPFNRRALVERPGNAPVLVVNGADDVHVPQADTLVFQGRPDAEVRLMPGTGHCVTSRLPEAVPPMVAWLRDRLAR